MSFKLGFLIKILGFLIKTLGPSIKILGSSIEILGFSKICKLTLTVSCKKTYGIRKYASQNLAIRMEQRPQIRVQLLGWVATGVATGPVFSL